MAEFIFKKMLVECGREDEFFVASSATSTEEIYRGIGNPIYPPARREMTMRGVEFDNSKRAVQLCRDDYDKYDLFVTMDQKNVRNALLIFGKDPDGKIKKLMDYTGRGGDVSDPWYSDRFDIAFDDIYEGCRALLSALEGDK
jgi:protein-tyrosine phosphatase